MTYLRRFSLVRDESRFFQGKVATYHESVYPFGIFPPKEVEDIEFSPITIFCGGNGSGKTTMLNVIAEWLELKRSTLYNKSDYFPTYVDACDASLDGDYEQGEIITSDDVFDYVLSLRCINEGVSRSRQHLVEDYFDGLRDRGYKLHSLDDFERLKRHNSVRKKSLSDYVRGRTVQAVRECSNGESAFRYFVEKFQDGGLYLLDEPENSLSPQRQVELVKLIEEAVRFFRCQFIIATHSPFFLGLREARIYDFDTWPVRTRPWSELEPVRVYHDFFEERRGDF